MKIELELPERLSLFLDFERGKLWNLQSMASEHVDHPTPSIAETIIHILDQERLAMEHGSRQSVIDLLKPNDIPF